MSDALIDQLLKKVSDSLVALMKACDVPQSRVHAAIEASYADVQIPLLTQAGTAPFRVAHRNLFGRMLTIWRNRPDYVGSDGSPRPLPLRGKSSSVESLFAHSTSGDTSDLDDIDPQAAIDILVSHGSVAINEDGHFYPISYSFRIAGDTQARAAGALAYMAEIGGTVTHNAFYSSESRLMAVARVQRLPTYLLPAIRATVRSKGEAFLTDADNYIESQKAGAAEAEDHRDIGVAIVYIEEPHDETR